MRIIVLADYRGVLTEETYYTAGTYAIPGDMPESHATALVAAGRGVEEVQKARRTSPKKKTTVTRRRRGRRAEGG